PEDFGTLAADCNGNLVYTARDQTRWVYNGSGVLQQVVDTHGLARVYGYDGAGRLTSVTAIDGGVTTFGYDGNGRLQSISEPGSRTVGLHHDGSGNLDVLTDADGRQRLLTYDGQHHLTRDRWAPFDTAFSYDPTTGLLAQVDRGLGTTVGVSPAAAQG